LRTASSTFRTPFSLRKSSGSGAGLPGKGREQNSCAACGAASYAGAGPPQLSNATARLSAPAGHVLRNRANNATRDVMKVSSAEVIQMSHKFFHVWR
jgi:hypothetical protein